MEITCFVLLAISASVVAFPRILPFRHGNNYVNCLSYDGRNCDVYLGFPQIALPQNTFRSFPRLSGVSGRTQRNYRIYSQEGSEDADKGNRVTLGLFIEAQCPDTTRFVHQQLFTAWQKLGSSSRIVWNIVPFGKAQCTPRGDGDFVCNCQHGPEECALNALMNCAMVQLQQLDRYMPLINCIQGRASLLDARHQCLDGQEIASVTRLMDCASGAEGRKLLAKAGQIQRQMAPMMNFVPWVTIDGTRSVDAMYDLTENLCNSLLPAPSQCKLNGS